MQNGVSIVTKDSDLQVNYGMYNMREERETARASLKYIYTDCCDLQSSYIRLGFHLIEFKNSLYYEDFGYLTFEDFCAANIGLDKGAISRCMNVCYRFSRLSDYRPSMFIDDKYKDYSYSQLCEMLPIKDAELKNIKPDMTIKQIREYKKNKKVSADVDLSSCDVATEKQYFDYDSFINKKGIVRQNYIKACESVDSRVLYLFDSDGKEIEGNFWLDVLAVTKDKIILRKY